MVKAYTYEGAVERLWQNVEITGCCWNWIGALNTDGYGKVGNNRFGTRHAHRVIYSLLMGNQPAELDHICHNRKCVNPDHLEAVTHQVNISRRRINHGTTHHTFKCGHSREQQVMKSNRARCGVCG